MGGLGGEGMDARIPTATVEINCFEAFAADEATDVVGWRGSPT